MLNKDLLSINANGFYFFEYDKSQVTPIVQSNRLPLVPISTKKGPFNNPVYIQQGDLITYETIFGVRDRSAERNGNYSWQAARYILQQSPAIFLNLRKFEDIDTTQAVTLSCNTEINNTGINSYKIKDFYDTKRFWKVSQEKIIKTTNNTDYVQFVNLGKDNVQIFVRKSTIKGYDTTVNDYFKSKGEDIPKYLYSESKIKDYIVDVYVFKGSLKNSNTTFGFLLDSNNCVLKSFTDNNGIVKDALDELTKYDESQFVGKYTGSLIYSMLDEKGNPFSIDSIFNQYSNVHSLACALNISQLDLVEDWEHDITVNPTNYPLLGQPLPIDLTGQNIINIENAGEVIDNTKILKNNVLSYKLNLIGLKTLSAYNAKDNQIGTNVIKYKGIRLDGTVTNSGGNYTYNVNSLNTIYVGQDMPHAKGESYFGIDGRASYIKNSTYVGTERVLTLKIHSNELPIYTDNTVFPKNTDGIFVYPMGHADEGQPVEYDIISGYPLDEIGGTAIPYPTLTQPQLAIIYTNYGQDRNIYKLVLSKDLYIDGDIDSITSVGETAGMKITFKNGTIQTVYSLDTVSCYHIPDISDLTPVYEGYTLNGYIPRAEQFCNGTAAKQSEILDILIQPNIFNALKNIDLIDFRFIIDVFKTYIEPNAKWQYGKIASEQKLSLAIINEPFTEDLSNSTDPYFKQFTTGDYDSIYYGTGGNLQLPYTKLFTKPSKENGDSYMAWYQSLEYSENRRNSSIISAPIIYNLFYSKLKNSIVSDAIMGDTYPINATNIIAPDYTYDDVERGNVEPYGLNTIVKKSGILQVYNNTTGQFNIKSAMSYIHNRETIIEIRRALIPIMRYAVGKTNNEQLRSYLKNEADIILKQYKDNGSIESFVNIVDTTNNTPEVIENAYSIIDTQIVFTYKAQKVVHRATYFSNTNTANFNTTDV